MTGEPREIWLQVNRRALWFGMILPAIAMAIGAWLCLGAVQPIAIWRRIVGIALMFAFGGIVISLLKQMRRGRIAYRDGQVLFYFGSAVPFAVPVDVVEAFFVGQQPLELPGRAPGAHAAVNLVARLSRRATEWHERDVKPALGRWSDGYVVIHGAWCEPLDGELIRRLNRRLSEVKTRRTATS